MNNNIIKVKIDIVIEKILTNLTLLISHVTFDNIIMKFESTL